MISFLTVLHKLLDIKNTWLLAWPCRRLSYPTEELWPEKPKLHNAKSTETSCHLILQKTSVNYHFPVVDGDFHFNIWHESLVDHSRYVSIINELASKVMKDMKDHHMDSTFIDKISRTGKKPPPFPPVVSGAWKIILCWPWANQLILLVVQLPENFPTSNSNSNPITPKMFQHEHSKFIFPTLYRGSTCFVYLLVAPPRIVCALRGVTVALNDDSHNGWLLCLKILHTHTWLNKNVDIAVLRKTNKIWNAVNDYILILLLYCILTKHGVYNNGLGQS